MKKKYIRAALYSAFIFPGFGQWSLGRRVRAVIVIVLIIICTFSLFINLAITLFPKVNQDVTNMMGSGHQPGLGTLLGYAFEKAGPYSQLVLRQFTLHVTFLLGLWLYSIIDIFFIFRNDLKHEQKKHEQGTISR